MYFNMLMLKMLETGAGWNIILLAQSDQQSVQSSLTPQISRGTRVNRVCQAVMFSFVNYTYYI